MLSTWRGMFLKAEEVLWRSQAKREDEVCKTVRYSQERELVLSSDERVLLVDQHEPLLHHRLLLLLVVTWKRCTNTHTQSYTHDCTLYFTAQLNMLII